MVAIFAEALSRFYFESGLWRDLDDLAAAGHKAAEALSLPGLRAMLLGLEGALAARRDQSDECVRLWLERVRLCEEIGDDHGLADALTDIGCHYNRGNRKAAISYLRRALPVAQRTNQRELVGSIYVIRGHNSLEEGNRTAALRWAGRAEKVVASGGRPDLLLFNTTTLGKILQGCDQPSRAEVHLRWSLKTAYAGERRWHVVEALLWLTEVYDALGQTEQAIRCIDAAKKLDAQIRTKWSQQIADRYDRLKARLKGTVFETIFDEISALTWQQIVQDLLD